MTTDPKTDPRAIDNKESSTINRFNLINLEIEGCPSTSSYGPMKGHIDFCVSEDGQEIEVTPSNRGGGHIIHLCPKDIYGLREVLNEIVEMIEVRAMENIL